MDGIWPGADIVLGPPVGDGFFSGLDVSHHLALATQLPLTPWNVFSHLSSFAWDWNILFTKMTDNKLHFLLVFIFFTFPNFYPNVSAGNMALIGHSLAHKLLIAPYGLSDKSRNPDLAFKAFWDLSLIHLSRYHIPLSVY